MTLLALSVPGPALAAPARPFFERHLAAPLLIEGPRGLLWWQWLAIPVFVAIALLAGAVLGWVSRRILGHLAARTRTTWDDALLSRVGAPNRRALGGRRSSPRSRRGSTSAPTEPSS